MPRSQSGKLPTESMFHNADRKSSRRRPGRSTLLTSSSVSSLLIVVGGTDSRGGFRNFDGDISLANRSSSLDSCQRALHVATSLPTNHEGVRMPSILYTECPVTRPYARCQMSNHLISLDVNCYFSIVFFKRRENLYKILNKICEIS